MKKLLLLICLTVGITSAQAQSPAVQTMAHSGDTVTNTETEYLTATLTGNYTSVTFQYVASKLSGTVAGTAILQASLDGTNYIDLDTITNTNVTTNTDFFTFSTNNKYKYYRINCTGSGTMAARVYCYVLAKP
jgi:hypothetical protein